MNRVSVLVAFVTLALVAAQVRLGGAQGPASGAATAGEKHRILLKRLETTIIRIEKELDGVLAVAIRDLSNGDTILVHADEVMPQASSIKIPIVAELYRQDWQAAGGAGRYARLGDLYTVRKADVVPDSQIMEGLTPDVTQVTNRDLATFVVAVSDNAATNVLIDRLGMDNVNQLLTSLGLKETRLRRKMMDLQAARQGRENTSTPREMMLLLEAIYREKLFDKARTEDFFRLLSTRKESSIPRLLPDSVRIANKPGALEAVRTDSGIVFVPNRPFIICAMTTYLRDERAGEEAISKVALAAYEYFNRLGRSSPYGRMVPPE